MFGLVGSLLGGLGGFLGGTGKLLFGSTSKAGVYSPGIGGALTAGAGSVLKYLEIIRQGKEIKSQADEAAAMRLQESANIAASTTNVLHALESEKYEAGGEFMGQLSTSGAALTGSALTRKKAIMAKYDKKKEMISDEAGRRRAMIEWERREIIESGKKALKSARRSAFASLLTGGFEFGKELGTYTGWWGKKGA